MQNDPEKEDDIKSLTKIFQDVRRRMNSKNALNTAPITACESIYAARWLEIFERQK